jgi:gamma-F420-2:alpha-L-glutamate ligase
MKRESKDGDFRANVSRGAVPTNFEVDYDAEYLALESSKLLHLDIAGVDLLIDEEGYKICEVNSAPGFQGLEAATNINIAETIVNYVLHRIAAPVEK